MAAASPPTPEGPAAAAPAPPVRRDIGDVIRVGGRRGYTDDLYHLLLQASWARVLLLMASMYLGINALFACLYLGGGDCVAGMRRGSFGDAFFFSVQTFSTIGYGVMAPKSAFGSAVVTLEAFCGLVTVAMGTGLMFAKFSRPTARVLFSDKMIIAPRNGKPTLMVRMANERSNEIVEASFRISILKSEVSAEGERMRRVHELKLTRGDTPIFTLTFLALHPIDEESPLHGLTPETMLAGEVRLIVTLTGIDATFATTVHARHVYNAEDVVWNARFADVISAEPSGQLRLDYGKFHDILPL